MIKFYNSVPKKIWFELIFYQLFNLKNIEFKLKKHLYLKTKTKILNKNKKILIIIIILNKTLFSKNLSNKKNA